MIITVIVHDADEALYERVRAAVDTVEGIDTYYIGLQTPEQYAADNPGEAACSACGCYGHSCAADCDCCPEHRDTTDGA